MEENYFAPENPNPSNQEMQPDPWRAERAAMASRESSTAASNKINPLMLSPEDSTKLSVGAQQLAEFLKPLFQETSDTKFDVKPDGKALEAELRDNMLGTVISFRATNEMAEMVFKDHKNSSEFRFGRNGEILNITSKTPDSVSVSQYDSAGRLDFVSERFPKGARILIDYDQSYIKSASIKDAHAKPKDISFDAVGRGYLGIHPASTFQVKLSDNCAATYAFNEKNQVERVRVFTQSGRSEHLYSYGQYRGVTGRTDAGISTFTNHRFEDGTLMNIGVLDNRSHNSNMLLFKDGKLVGIK